MIGKHVVIDTLDNFKAKLDLIPSSAIVLIKDVGQIYAHGTYFGAQKTYSLLTKTADGLAPKGGTSASSLISNVDAEWVLTVTNGENPTWRKLPANAFSSSSYTLPSATVSDLGGIKVGQVYTATFDDLVGLYYKVNIDKNGLAYVHVPWINNPYTASGSGITLKDNVFSLSLNSVTKLDSAIGNKIYAVSLDKNGKLCVSVPWTDTNNIFVGATETKNGSSGMVPAPIANQHNYFLRGDGTWVKPNLSDLNDDIVRGKYLPLTGGTLTGSGTDVLYINSTYGNVNDNGTYIILQHKGVKTAEFGHGWGIGTYIKANKYNLRIDNDGIGYVTNNVILHLGNYTNYALSVNGGSISNSDYGALNILRESNDGFSGIAFSNWSGINGYLGVGGSGSDFPKQPAFVDSSYTIYQIWHSGTFNPSDYLPLSGGTISGTTTGPLNIDTTSTVEVGIPLKMSSVTKGWLGYSSTAGTYLYNNASKHYLGIKDDGSIYYNKGTILYSGNYNEYALPLTGGTITGSNAIPLIINSTSTGNAIELRLELNSANKADFGWDSTNGIYVYEATSKKFLGINTSGIPFFYDGKGRQEILHQNNYSSYALPLTGGLMGGAIQWGSASLPVSISTSSGYLSLDSKGSEICVAAGDNDALFINYRKSANGYAPTSWHIFKGDATGYAAMYAGNIYSNGESVIHSGNIGSQSVSYASNADTLDGYHASAFMRVVKDNSYYGIQHPDGGTSDWTRTTTSGIIPYSSGGASSLGTTAWPFSTIYANNFYGYLNGNISGAANMISHSTYYYSGNVMKNSTSSDTIFGTTNTANYLFPSFMGAHPTWGGYADVINFTGYCKWGGTQLATQYDAINPRVAIRKYNQSRSDWGDWTELANINSNVASATKLQTARTIWGKSFDGTSNVNGVLTLGTSYITGNDGADILNSLGQWCYLGAGTSEKGFPTYIDGHTIRIRYGTTHTEGVRISSSGNVGIGTTNPQYKLDVNGTIYGSHYYGDAITLYTRGDGTYTRAWITAKDSAGDFIIEAPLTAESSGTRAPITLTWRGGYPLMGGIKITGYSEAVLGGNKIWHAGNDGSGSGLDADLLDGYHISVGAAGTNSSTIYFVT